MRRGHGKQGHSLWQTHQQKSMLDQPATLGMVKMTIPESVAKTKVNKEETMREVYMNAHPMMDKPTDQMPTLSNWAEDIDTMWAQTLLPPSATHPLIHLETCPPCGQAFKTHGEALITAATTINSHHVAPQLPAPPHETPGTVPTITTTIFALCVHCYLISIWHHSLHQPTSLRQSITHRGSPPQNPTSIPHHLLSHPHWHFQNSPAPTRNFTNKTEIHPKNPKKSQKIQKVFKKIYNQLVALAAM